MLGRLRLPSPAIVVALAAVVLAAGGIAGAASSGTKVRVATLTVHYGKCNLVFGGIYNCNAPASSATAHCKSGENATGGGFGKSNDGTTWSFKENRPSPNNGTPKGWTVSTAATLVGSSGETKPNTKISIFAVCEKG